jgi:2-polyprenyl-6-methoxyphenol hydroxylase-like FAD-dependent oxidoreductase
MSPVGGVGINLAIQDAVAAANLLYQSLLDCTKSHTQSSNTQPIDALLPQLQKRREFPTRVTQSFQVFAHKRFITPALGATQPVRNLPLPLKLLRQFPFLRRLPARFIGLGARPEHIRTPNINAS